MSALIESFPFTIPIWMPEVISFLSRFDRERHPIGSAVKKTIAEFKRTHNEQWHILKHQFTSEQLNDIQDVSGLHSYFV